MNTKTLCMSFFLLMIPHVLCVADDTFGWCPYNVQLAEACTCVNKQCEAGQFCNNMMAEECMDPCPNQDGTVQIETYCNCLDSTCGLSQYCNIKEDVADCQLSQAIHCKVSEWTEFSQCTARCGPQTSTRTRSIIQKAANGGKVCPILSETKECDLPPCPTVVAENCKATPFFHTGDTNEGKLVGDCQLGELIHIDAENFGDLIHFCRSECFDNPDCGYFQVTRHTDNCVLFDKLTTCDKLVPTKDVFVYLLDCPPPVVEGCTNPEAYNYNVAADRDDGSCVQVVKGCTDPKSPNYDENANIDDGSCQKPGRRILNEEGVQVPRLILQEEERN